MIRINYTVVITDSVIVMHIAYQFRLVYTLQVEPLRHIFFTLEKFRQYFLKMKHPIYRGAKLDRFMKKFASNCTNPIFFYVKSKTQLKFKRLGFISSVKFRILHFQNFQENRGFYRKMVFSDFRLESSTKFYNPCRLKFSNNISENI